MFRNIYKGRNVFVTGHTGFKGSWLTQWLLNLEAKVTGYSLYLPSEPALFEELHLEGQIKSLSGDIRDYAKLEASLQEAQPEIVFHLAAQPIVTESYRNPLLTFETNAMGTAYLLEAVRQCPSVQALVLITSDKCYENVEWEFGYRENDRLGGKDPYSASKACAENIIYSYWASFFSKKQGGVGLASARAGNVIGGGDWAKDRIIPDCIRAWAKNETAEIRNPYATRPWQHVLEPLSGYLELGAQLFLKKQQIIGHSFNFGPNADVIETVEILVSEMARKWEGKKWASGSIPAANREASLLKLCCDKALFHLNWKPTLTFSETVDFTTQWYKSFYEEKDAKQLTMNQIISYQELAKSRNRTWALN